jgi:methyl-accepting chemotaxis protein
MDLNQAIQAHGEWKMKFRIAINKQENMDVGNISADNCCMLGKWLYGEARTQFGKLASHANCLAKHAIFHQEAGKVAQAINAKRFGEAENMLNGDSTYNRASNAVAAAIMTLKREAHL